MSEDRDWKGIAGILVTILIFVMGMGVKGIMTTGDVATLAARIEANERSTAVLEERVERNQENVLRTLTEIQRSVRAIEEELKNP